MNQKITHFEVQPHIICICVEPHEESSDCVWVLNRWTPFRFWCLLELKGPTPAGFGPFSCSLCNLCPRHDGSKIQNIKLYTCRCFMVHSPYSSKFCPGALNGPSSDWEHRLASERDDYSSSAALRCDGGPISLKLPGN